MIDDLPYYVSIVFVVTTVLTCWFFYQASYHSKITLLILGIWLCFQAGLGLSGFYIVTDIVPPRYPFLLLPPLCIIAILFATPSGRRYIDNLSLDWLILLHSIRIPVEFVLFWLSLYQIVPDLMTFEGRNLDMVSGITALFVYFFLRKGQFPRSLLILWNILCLGLVLNVLLIGILSAPSLFQQFAFDQPNTAIQYFPFVWLPSTVVPIVVFSHLVALRQLLIKQGITAIGYH